MNGARLASHTGGLLRRAAESSLGRRLADSVRETREEPPLDGWLAPCFGPRLDQIEAACLDRGEQALPEFAELDDDLWALLLTKRYDSYPGIRSVLPEVPDPSLQRAWNGAEGAALAAQSVSFYRKVKLAQATHGSGSLADARLLDFGCGWGRLMRFFSRDMDASRIFGCDPVQSILDVCISSRVPGRFARSEFLPESIPFDESFELAYSFSVFTHISEQAALSCLRSIHAAQPEGGILVITVRPPAYLELSDLMRQRPEVLALRPEQLTEPRFVFVPHAADPEHPQFDGSEMHYGETVITIPYIRERWGSMYELLDVSPMAADPYQVVVTLGRRS